MSKIDSTGKLIIIQDDGLVKLDGVPILRRVVIGGILHLQFCDNDRMRSQLRKTRYVEIPADVLIRILNGENNADAHVAHSPME